MARYKSKPIEVDAWKFEGGIFSAAYVLKQAGLPEHHYRLQVIGWTITDMVSGEFRDIVVNPGDWLVRHEDGSLAAYDDAQFEKAFAPAAEEARAA